MELRGGGGGGVVMLNEYHTGIILCKDYNTREGESLQ